jgi:hypothetical protein
VGVAVAVVGGIVAVGSDVEATTVVAVAVAVAVAVDVAGTAVAVCVVLEGAQATIVSRRSSIIAGCEIPS